MVKSKKPKKAVNLQPEYATDPNAPKHNKKKKKNAPDRPQPEWMFPPDEENPVLRPKAKSDEEKLKAKQEHDHAINFLKYKSVTTPLKAPPPALLLTLVGAFLTSYGFNSTSRIYSTELASKKKLDEWKVVMDQKLPKGFPDLVKLFKEGHKTYEDKKKMDETSSSDEYDDDKRKAYKKSRKNVKKGSKQATPSDDETSSSGSEDSSNESDSDAEMGDVPPVSNVSASAAKPAAKRSLSESSASTSSDSDADDEKEPSGTLLRTSEPLSTATVNRLVNKLKRKASPKVSSESASASSESSSEISSSESDSEKKDIVTSTKPVTIMRSDSDSSSSSDDSEFKVESKHPTKTKITATFTTDKSKSRNDSSSSETLKATSDAKTSTAETSLSSSTCSSDSKSSDADIDAQKAQSKVAITTTQSTITTKRKRSSSPAPVELNKKQQKQIKAPFERVPKDTQFDERFTNKYQSYDYADRAYQDLNVTKGKGFTKEKNKKKRGSYRGGAIDTRGGKGIKFED